MKPTLERTWAAPPALLEQQLLALRAGADGLIERADCALSTLPSDSAGLGEIVALRDLLLKLRGEVETCLEGFVVDWYAQAEVLVRDIFDGRLAAINRDLAAQRCTLDETVSELPSRCKVH